MALVVVVSNTVIHKSSALVLKSMGSQSVSWSQHSSCCGTLNAYEVLRLQEFRVPFLCSGTCIILRKSRKCQPPASKQA